MRRLALVGLLLGAAIVLLLVLPLHMGHAVPQLDRWWQTADAIGVRGYLWRHAWQMFLDHPWLGAGFDAFAFTLIGQLQTGNEVSRWGIDQFAHNLLLQLLACGGLAGALAWLLPGAALVRRQCALAWTPGRLWGWGLAGVLLIHSLLEQPLYFAYFLGVIALLLGMLDVTGQGISISLRRRSLAILLLPGLLLLVKTASDYEQLASWFYGTRDLSRAGQMAERHEIARQLHDRSLFTAHIELASPGDFVPENAPDAEKIAFNLRVMHFAPVAEIEFRHAALLVQAHRVADAKVQFRRAAYAYPDQAREYLRRISALATNDSATWGELAAYGKVLLASMPAAFK